MAVNLNNPLCEWKVWAHTSDCLPESTAIRSLTRLMDQQAALINPIITINMMQKTKGKLLVFKLLLTAALYIYMICK
jgi:hypothetical protein